MPAIDATISLMSMRSLVAAHVATGIRQRSATTLEVLAVVAAVVGSGGIASGFGATAEQLSVVVVELGEVAHGGLLQDLSTIAPLARWGVESLLEDCLLEDCLLEDCGEAVVNIVRPPFYPPPSLSLRHPAAAAPCETG